MCKLSFRARPLEASKPMPIFMSEELPDLPEYSAISRAVPQMPSGMKKEEESEHHLQRAMVAGLIIPTPEVSYVDMDTYNRLYPSNYKVPRQLIHMQPFTMEQDIPDYDMDSEDEEWLAVLSKSMNITDLKFEEMMDRLEKNSGHSLVTQTEAKFLFNNEDDDLIIAVYDYWLNKRLKLQQPLIARVKIDFPRYGNNNNNPYLAFRRRTEKMQTRKNRKNDESTYEKMVKLKRDLTRALNLLQFVKRRENTKRELLQLTVEIYEKRYQAQDFSGTLLAEVSALKTPRPAFAPLFTNQYNHGTSWNKTVKDDFLPRKEKRQYKKRKHNNLNNSQIINDVADIISSGYDDSHNDEAPFAFRRKRQCLYHAPLSTMGNWPWCSREDGGQEDPKYRFNLTSISTPDARCIGLGRRRVGRGGRVIIDRAGPSMDDFWSSLDFTIHDNNQEKTSIIKYEETVIDGKEIIEGEEGTEVDPNPLMAVDDKCPLDGDDKALAEEKSSQLSDSYLNWPHFHPKSPVKLELDEDEMFNYLNTNAMSLSVEDLNEPTCEHVPVQLNLSELFPTLTWETTDQGVGTRESDLETITPPNESDECPSLDVIGPSEPIAPELLLNKLSNKSNESDIEVTPKNFNLSFIDKNEYQSGSLLDRWARSKSPSSEPVKIQKPITEVPFLDGLAGCSAFRTSNYWPEPKVQIVSEPNPVVPVTVEEASENTSVVVYETPHLPPTPPKEIKTPPPSNNIDYNCF